MGLAPVCSDTMNQLIYPTSQKDGPTQGTRHTGATNPDPSLRGTVGAFLTTAIVVMAMLFPTAMLAAAITVAAVWTVGLAMEWRRPSTISVPGTGREIQLSFHR